LVTKSQASTLFRRRDKLKLVPESGQIDAPCLCRRIHVHLGCIFKVLFCCGRLLVDPPRKPQQHSTNNTYTVGAIERVKAKIHYASFPVTSSLWTSWRGQKSVVSVVSCRFPNSIRPTTTCCSCCGLVGYVPNKFLTSCQT